MLNKKNEIKTLLDLEKRTYEFVIDMFKTFFDLEDILVKEFKYQVNDCSTKEELFSVVNDFYYKIDDNLKTERFFDLTEETYEICKELIIEQNNK